MSLKDLLFGFKGRIRRRDWWLWGIGVSLAWLVVLTPLGAALFDISLTTSLLGGPGLPRGWTFTAFSFATFLPLLWVHTALAAKRAHDRNHEALIAAGLTALAGIVSFAPEVVDLVTNASLTDSQFNAVYMATSLGTFAIHVYLLITQGFLDGTPGPNRFGPSPKAAERPSSSEPGETA